MIKINDNYILGDVNAVCDYPPDRCVIHFKGGGELVVPGSTKEIAKKLGSKELGWRTGEPEKEGRYICARGSLTLPLSWCGTCWHGETGQAVQGVTHWQPYPEAPK